MNLKKSIGKNTLGGGKKMNVDLKTYNRSTHDLSYIWRSSMAAGTLVPFCKILMTPGDTMEIDLTHQIMTHPTIGPLFGSYKVQADVFQCPIRLYNAMLHNNALNIGLKMSDVKLPKIAVTLSDVDTIYHNPKTERQISESCVLAYLGQRGYAGMVDKDLNEGVEIKRNAIPLIAYYDIFKNYYANKQEEDFYTIAEYSKVNYGDILISTVKAALATPTNLNINRYIGVWKGAAFYDAENPINSFKNKIISVSNEINGEKIFINYRIEEIVDEKTGSDQVWNINPTGKQDSRACVS